MNKPAIINIGCDVFSMAITSGLFIAILPDKWKEILALSIGYMCLSVLYEMWRMKR